MSKISLLLMLSVVFLIGCNRSDTLQGYLEADLVYIAPVTGGKIDRIAVKRGDPVQKGTLLFVQDRTEQLAALAEARADWQKAQADLQDLLKGSRQEELNALQAKIDRMESVVKLDEIEYRRSLKLRQQDAVSIKEFDSYRLTLERDRCDLEEAKHNLSIGKLPARSDRIAAAEAEVKATSEALAAAQWRLDQRQSFCPYDGIIFDVLMRDGEYAAAGAATVMLLPSDKLKVRFFVNADQAAAIRRGQPITFRTASGGPVYSGRINYIAPKPEYTPPVIYSNDNREKLVFLIEAVADPDRIAELHPGLPVTVTLASESRHER